MCQTEVDVPGNMPHHPLRCRLGKSKGPLDTGGEEEDTIAEAGEATRTTTPTEVEDNAFKAVGPSEVTTEEAAVISTATTEDFSAEDEVEDIAEVAGIITTIITTTEVLGIIKTLSQHRVL